MVQLSGGPYSGCKFPLSTNGLWDSKTYTLKFSAKGYVGQYDKTGRWHGTYVGIGLDLNENIILSGTE